MLIALVKEKKLDLGIGYDGDGDRIGVVDETGRIVYGDQLMIVFAREILARKPGSTFISEVKCSKTMYDDIRKNGGKAVMWKTGHSLIKKKMKEEKAALAASGIVTDSGSALDVQEGAREANVLDTATVLHNAQLEAYGYRSQASNFEAQKRLKILEGEQADAGPGTMAGLGTILSGVGSAGAKWAAANPSSPKTPTGSYSGGTGTNPLTGLRYGGV